jgi:ubiquinone/menaquinone biosynthesis C-methylase UbiE
VSSNRLLGFVDSFDGESLSGWALDRAEAGRAVEVDILVDHHRVASVIADQLRDDLGAISPDNPRRGFAYLFSPPLCGSEGPLLLPRIPSIGVLHGGTDLRLGVVPELMGVVNTDPFNQAEALCVRADNRFLPTPPQDMLEHVAGDGATPTAYRAVGMFLVLDLLQLGLLADPGLDIVDVGCGCGRLATQLAPYLKDDASYVGFDTWATGVSWASQVVTLRYPRFAFELLTRSGARTREGYVGEHAYPLPVADASCDLVIASSLLTHLTYSAAVGYLTEFRRVLRPSGRAYVTFFFFDAEAERLLSGLKLRRDEHGAYYKHRAFFDSYFREEAVSRMVREAGLRPVVKRLGHWRGERYTLRRPIGAQDLLVLRRE